MFGCFGTHIHDSDVRDEGSGQPRDNYRASWSSARATSGSKTRSLSIRLTVTMLPKDCIDTNNQCSVAYSGFHKWGEDFLWTLMFTQKGPNHAFLFFPLAETDLFAKRGLDPMPPKWLQCLNCWGSIIHLTLICKYPLPSTPAENKLSWQKKTVSPTSFETIRAHSRIRGVCWGWVILGVAYMLPLLCHILYTYENESYNLYNFLLGSATNQRLRTSLIFYLLIDIAIYNSAIDGSEGCSGVYHGATVPRCHGATVPRCHCATVPRCHCATGHGAPKSLNWDRANTDPYVLRRFILSSCQQKFSELAFFTKPPKPESLDFVEPEFWIFTSVGVRRVEKKKRKIPT